MKGIGLSVTTLGDQRGHEQLKPEASDRYNFHHDRGTSI